MFVSQESIKGGKFTFSTRAEIECGDSVDSTKRVANTKCLSFRTLTSCPREYASARTPWVGALIPGVKISRPKPTGNIEISLIVQVNFVYRSAQAELQV